MMWGPSPEESQDLKALQKELEQFAELLERKGTPSRYRDWHYPGLLVGKVQPADHLPL